MYVVHKKITRIAIIPTTINKVINKLLEETNNQLSDSSSHFNSLIFNFCLNESDSTCDETKSWIINNYSEFVNSFTLIINEKKLNPARANYILKYKLNDVTYTGKEYEINQPPKYQVGNELSTFIYPNLTITHCFSLSELLKSSKLNFDNVVINEKVIDESTYEKQFGLFFCRKEIIIENGIKKNCAPNEFMCRKCMDINKKIYFLKKHYLINIIGRVSKINKGGYHCFGQFLVNNIIEDCISNFTCEGCKLLNLFSKDALTIGLILFVE